MKIIDASRESESFSIYPRKSSNSNISEKAYLKLTQALSNAEVPISEFSYGALFDTTTDFKCTFKSWYRLTLSQ